MGLPDGLAGALPRRFRFLDLTLPTLDQDLALDEALLQEVEEDGLPPVLRIWESPGFAVILGASGRLVEEIHVDACQADGVPILRRSSGGGTVVIGPGALNFTVVLPLDGSPRLQAVDLAQRSVLGRVADALRHSGPPVEVQGSGDLTLGDRKFAGSAQRRLRRHFLVHASILYDFPLERIGRYLAPPKRQPAYREGRPHEAFVTNLGLPRSVVVEALRAAWLPPDAEIESSWPEGRVRTLVGEKFAHPGWIARL